MRPMNYGSLVHWSIVMDEIEVPGQRHLYAWRYHLWTPRKTPLASVISAIVSGEWHEREYIRIARVECGLLRRDGVYAATVDRCMMWPGIGPR